MLVLSRKEGQRVLIGDNIVITVNRVSGNRITLGIEAPKDVRVVRGELEATNAAPQGLAMVEGNTAALDGLEIELPAPLAERMRSGNQRKTPAKAR